VDFDIPIEAKYLDGRYEKLNVRIRRVNTGFFRLSSRVNMGANRRVTLFYNGTRIEGSVLYSNKAPDGSFNVGIVSDQSNVRLRREARVETGIKAYVKLPGLPSPLKVKVVDLSRNGIGMLCGTDLPVSSQICVEFDNCIAFAEVRHSTRAKRKFRVGCSVEEFIHFNTSRQAKPRLWTTLWAAVTRNKPARVVLDPVSVLAQR
jgi:hypothetical protein